MNAKWIIPLQMLSYINGLLESLVLQLFLLPKLVIKVANINDFNIRMGLNYLQNIPFWVTLCTFIYNDHLISTSM